MLREGEEQFEALKQSLSEESPLKSINGPAIDRVALGQFNPTTGDLRGNTLRIIERIESARAERAQMIVLPEMAISGYCVGDTLGYDEFVEDNQLMLKRICEASKDIIVIVGFVDYDHSHRNEDGSLRKYNAAAVIQDTEIKGIVHKQNLPNYRYFDDKRHFSEGGPSAPIQVEIDGKPVKLGVVICEDMWDANYNQKPVRDLAKQGANIIVSINASPYVPGKFETRDQLIRKHIAETHLPFIYLNTAGVADNGKNLIPFDGQSLIYDDSGNLLAFGRQFEEELKNIKLNGAKPVAAPLSEKVAEQCSAIEMAIEDYCRKTGFNGDIEVSLSGGVDSAVVAALAVKRFGKERVVLINQPSKHNKAQTIEMAERIAKNLGCRYSSVGIQEAYETMLSAFENQFHPIRQKVTKQNIQARLRGINSMIESNDSGSLLLSCGNKTEIALGYATLYGDMCGGISPIGDLNKMQVYKVGRYLNQWFLSNWGHIVIPEEVLDMNKVVPSAELEDNQYDPFDYTVISPLVDEFVDGRRSPSQVIQSFKLKQLNPSEWELDAKGQSVYDKHSVESFSALAYDTFTKLQRAVYKRLQGAPIISVTESTFGFDRREPLINWWHGR